MFRTTSPARRMSRLTAARVVVPALVALGTLVAAGAANAGFRSFSMEGGGGFPDEANGRTADDPAVTAYRLRDGETIDLDGRLDDTCWNNAVTGYGFTQWDPNRGEAPSEETMFKIAYDEDAVYFAVACQESNPANIARTLSRRDRHESCDYVSIFIDPYHDKTTGYNFRVNPAGVLQDRYVYDDGDTDTNWDSVWEAETYQDSDGWYVEIRIPFSSIRYRQNIDAWGLQVRRYMHGRGEDDSWTSWDRDTPGFVSRFGSVRGINGIRPPRQLELLPYTVARATDPSVQGPGDEVQDFENFGLDMKYGVTADLTLNATFQPDFGQVEADPAVLNLGPYETFFDEKRPFFIEGSRFFEHPEFNLFYSRRIGSGSDNTRIRYASKLTGKVAGDVSVAALFAGTDVTEDGQAHNFFKNGSRPSQYFVGRVGKEWNGGQTRVNVMQTAVVNSASREDVGDRGSREAYTTGFDFRRQFADRQYTVTAAAVGSILDHENLSGASAQKNTYGTGGEISAWRSGNVSTGSWFRWESDRLDINDIGFLSAPDEMNMGAWLSYHWNPESDHSLFNTMEVNVNTFKGWLYGDRTGYDFHTGDPIWSYSKGHRAFANGNVNGWMQFKNYAEAWWGVEYVVESTQRYETRSSVELESGDTASIPGGGPLITEPTTWGSWWGASTDTRKDLVLGSDGSWFADAAHNYSLNLELDLGWKQSNALTHELSMGYNRRVDDTQHLGNFENEGEGIGGVSYVFGEIDQTTIDLTLRSNILFSRNQSLELYAQPFIAVGDYTNGRELVTPDTYDLRAYTRDGFQASDFDFSFAAVNVNAVYRWEYRPGSTLFLVWSHARGTYDQRSFNPPGRFNNDIDGDALFSNEPENTFLVKLTYWLPM